MGLSWSHILIVAVLFVLLFGRGKISELMGDVAKGIKSFKKGMSDDEDDARAERVKSLPQAREEPMQPSKTPESKPHVG